MGQSSTQYRGNMGTPGDGSNGYIERSEKTPFYMTNRVDGACVSENTPVATTLNDIAGEACYGKQILSGCSNAM